MKKTLIALLLATGFAFGHGGVELGPNKGRILEFSTDETMHGEVVEKNGKLHIALLDKDMKPVKVEAQSLAATAGTRAMPVKLEVAKAENGFTVPAPGDGEWLILQFKDSDSAKPITARLHYDKSVCGECQSPEWLCSCPKKD